MPRPRLRQRSSFDPALAERINTESERLAPKLTECRRWFHRHPELSNREQGTAAEIARRLREIVIRKLSERR